MKILIDTDILSEIQRAKNTVVTSRAAAFERTYGPLSLSTLSVFENLLGWHHKGLPERADAFLAWVRGCEVLDFDVECARLGGEIGGALLRAGRPIGLADVGDRGNGDAPRARAHHGEHGALPVRPRRRLQARARELARRSLSGSFASRGAAQPGRWTGRRTCSVARASALLRAAAVNGGLGRRARAW